MSAAVGQTTSHAAKTPHGRSFGWYGMVFFLASESFFFANLIASYLYLRVRNGGPLLGRDALDVKLSAVNTVVLISSSFVLMWAMRGLNKGNQRQFRLGLGLTALLGALFVTGQAIEYASASFGPSSNIFGSAFFVLTGFHGAHVIVGVLFLLVCFFRALRGDYSADKHFSVMAAEMYWHFVDVVWVILFTVLYILQ